MDTDSGVANLRAVVAAPSEDAPRIAYASWLDGQGDGDHAAFIRVCLQLDSTEAAGMSAIGVGGLERSGNALIRRMAAAGGALLPHDIDPLGQLWERGFVRAVRLTCDQFMRHAAVLFAGHPIVAVGLLDKKPAGRAHSWGFELLQDSSARRKGKGGFESHLPQSLYSELQAINPSMTWSAEFSAAAFLSLACVNHGRRLAGLPRIVPPLPIEDWSQRSAVNEAAQLLSLALASGF